MATEDTANREEKPEAIDGRRFVELLGASEHEVFRYVYTLTANWNDAEEVMQRVRIRLWEQFADYDADKPFATWARAVAYYLVLAYRKEKARRPFSECVLDQLSKDYEDQAYSLDLRYEAMISCLQSLPSATRQLVVDYYEHRGAVGHIATKGGLTVAALRQKLYRVRKKLHTCVQLRLSSTP